MKTLEPVTDNRPGYMRGVEETITCECGATVLENDMTKELIHVGPCTVTIEENQHDRISNDFTNHPNQ